MKGGARKIKTFDIFHYFNDEIRVSSRLKLKFLF